jgi:hypothetical protein
MQVFVVQFKGLEKLLGPEMLDVAIFGADSSATIAAEMPLFI